MAKTQLKYGKDPEMRKLAEDIIKAQQPEIDQMQAWLKRTAQTDPHGTMPRNTEIDDLLSGLHDPAILPECRPISTTSPVSVLLVQSPLLFTIFITSLISCACTSVLAEQSQPL